MTLPLKLPTIQNWSCHNCAGCCRQHAIEITAAERARIVSQNWEPEPGFGPQQPILTWHSGPWWRKQYRLAHRADGACVFLDERGLCRIHAKFGEAAKPLACQIYPYAFHPAGRQITVSLRFSCPSVVANRGRSVTDSRDELRLLERLVVPPEAQKIPPPRISARAHVPWKETLEFVDQLDHTLAQPRQPILDKVLAALFWIGLSEQARYDKLKGPRLREFLELIRGAAAQELPRALQELDAPSPLAQTYFRMLVAQYARKDTAVELRQGWLGRLRLLRTAVRFTRGHGVAPALQACFREAPFADIEAVPGPVPAEAEEILTRYFRVKVQGLHFCGRAYYGIPLCEGFQSLAAVLPVVLWLARWLAVSHERAAYTSEDVARALAIADHHHGYSPVFGTGSFRSRIRWLNQQGQLARLCVRYAR